MDILSKVVAVILLCIAVFIVPILNLATSQDEMTQSVVYNITAEFVDTVREQGKITQDMYTSFIEELDSTGGLYEVELTHSHPTVNPVFSEGTVTGTTKTDNIVYKSDILNKLYSTDGLYTMNQYDTFTVTVYNKKNTLGQNIRRMLFNYYDNSHPIFVQYGGVIRDENY